MHDPVRDTKLIHHTFCTYVQFELVNIADGNTFYILIACSPRCIWMKVSKLQVGTSYVELETNEHSIVCKERISTFEYIHFEAYVKSNWP